MRLRGACLAVGAATVLMLAACTSLPEGVDGDLTGDWGDFGEPVGFAPAADVCHQESYLPAAPLRDYAPVDCDQPHLTETVHVGSFSGEAAEGDAPPQPGSGALRLAYGECEEQVAELLGADFRHGRLWLGVATPSEAGWGGGARWFRCDLLEVESVYGEPVERQDTLAGALSDDSPVGLGCFTADVDDSDVENMSPVACDEPHQVEFVGVWDAPDGPYLDFENDNAEARVYEGCREQVAEYVDVPVDGDLVYRTGTIADWMSEQDWDSGDRAFRCYLWLPDSDLTESLAGAGPEALPVRTE